MSSCVSAVMEVSPQDPVLVAMDLSKSYSPLSRSHADDVDLSKKPEWYHRRPPSCSTDVPSTFRSRPSASYSSPAASIHCRDVEQRPESLGGYMNSTLAPGLDLFHDRVHGSLWHAGFCGTDQSGSPLPESSGGEESDSGSDVIFLVSSAKEPLLCGSFIQDGVGHMVEPLSPAVSSLDEGRGCYLLPQPLSSPSPDSSYSEDSSDSSVDIPVHHTRPVVLLSDLNAVYGNPAESDVEVSSDDSDLIEVSVTDSKKQNQAPPPREREKTPQRKVRRSSRMKKPAAEPARLSRSVTRRSLKRRVKYSAVGIYNENCDSDDLMEFAEKFSSSEESDPQAVLPQTARTRSEESDLDVRTDRKSPLREQPPRKAPRSRTVRHQQEKKKKPLAAPETKAVSRTKQNWVHRTGPQQKKQAVRRRRKKRRNTGPSALFPPREPEILLKYLKAKEQRKDKKADGFCPFVHMEQRVCRVVNYQDEESTVQSSRRPHGPTLSGFVPCTSCFQLGRPSSDAGHQAELRCCLCGQTANVLGLGDLHGPYCPTRMSLKEQKLSNGCLPTSSEDDCSAENSVLRGDGLRPSKGPPLDECWVHEDCSIWAAGVFLVQGKLYGLEEAARLAQETICSSCRQTGAIMGCFQKNCCRNYHSTCAVQSGCVLNEDNFSMRCPEHKNKSFSCPSRRDKR
ncbi:transcription factor 20-like isoform X2 [Kryptolebias marmoratus]|uniref:transcription factor 20-like isoform X2 n=1 Tax=Kryptolebias marmoratus TaxID=37003 RepID=UPI0007F91230|nr:transcription factor 20-like isoform X2 [Kryptolebias marmoratus]